MLTHKEVSVLVLFPFLKNINWDINKVAAIMGIPINDLKNHVEEAKKPFAYGEPEPVELTALQTEQINALEIPGVFAVEKNLSAWKFQQNI